VTPRLLLKRIFDGFMALRHVQHDFIEIVAA
jgi:hypothetical protein